LNFLKISSPFEFGADMISVAESRLIRSINCLSAVINRRIDPAFQRGIRLKDMQGKRSVFPGTRSHHFLAKRVAFYLERKTIAPGHFSKRQDER
jgi:hypothetical protein